MFERVLITGGGGQLASDLENQLAPHAEVLAPTHAVLDIADEHALAEVISRLEPDLVINCAALHNVEDCERAIDEAFAVNVRAVLQLARHCVRASAKLVHLSTNYVFDGAAPAPYTEEAPAAPLSVYGISKLAGEQAALAYAPGALVVRTAGLYGLQGSASKGGNFVVRMIARAQEHGALRVVADQMLTPTFTADLACGIVSAVAAGVTGLLHLTNAGATSWHGFTEEILELAGVEVPVEAVQTVLSPGGAPRPLNGVLQSSVASHWQLAPLRPWNDALADYLDRAGLLARGDSRLIAAAPLTQHGRRPACS